MSEKLYAEGASFAELFDRVCKERTWEDNVVKGIIIGIDDNFVTIDVGLKSEGRIALSEFTTGDKKIEMKIGDKIDVYIDRYENRSGEIVLSREKALKEAAWDDFEKAFKEGVSIMGTMCSRVKGGFMVDLHGVTAFLPGSQVDVRPVKDITPLMGIEQPFLILKMDKIRENIVVSRRGILEGANAEERAKVVANLEEGQVIDGVVKNVTNYGAFVDIGGVDGLLHNTDISWKRINHPSEVLTPGQEVKVKIIKFNKETKRISLGMKQLAADPWSDVNEEFQVGARIKGKVTNVTDYGIFVEIKEGVEGLVYVSEISWKKNVAPSKVVTAGEEIEVVVLDVDVAKRRIGLGLKQLQTNPWNDVEKDFPVGHVFEGTISNVTDFGLFVKINNNIDGMVHINDISWQKIKEEEFAKYKKGDVIKVKILEIDQEKERISLGIKQLTESPYGNAELSIKKGQVVTCIVSAIKEDGVEVTLANGRVGFIKKIDLAKDRQDRKLDRFAVGEKVDAKITSIDKTGKKIGLSIKVLEIEEEKQVMAEFGSSDSGASLGDILGIVMEKKNSEKIKSGEKTKEKTKEKKSKNNEKN
ncbi:MAG: 30S ribosomal protein S1 [Holosporaceae bacterium]|jgi:small subunit ribosomal protein S1|nr:30S ribosomal protein S1 [Holosporaceae bacterium]